MIKLYNTLSRKKEEFKEVEKGKLKIYSCGPTVYSFQHIGNMRAALCWDFLKKSFRYFGYEVIDVQNITDVGHLVSDEDDGEDKMLKASKKENKNPYEIAKFYENAYVKDLKRLNIILAKFNPKATQEIPEQIDMIKELEKNGFTYKTSDGIYFDVSKFEDYGKLSGQSLEEKQSGARVEIDTEKRNPADFALWKFLTKDNLNHVMKWDTPWGIGFPGWHIECSAMSHKYLGEFFDIHTGGIEHIPVHHENEIAQNVCSHKVKGVSFWLHNNHMLVDNEKMSKSLGSVYLVEDLIKKGYNPLALREICLRSHYRKQINFTFESLDSGEKNVKKINDFYNKIKNSKTDEKVKNKIEEICNKNLKVFEEGLSDDLNTPIAISAVDEFMSEINKIENLTQEDVKLVLNFMEKTDIVLGLLEKEEVKIPTKVVEFANRRKLARDNKDFKLSDEIRNEIIKLGFKIKDDKNSKEGFILNKI